MVEWDDSAQPTSAWCFVDGLDVGIIRCRSVGWVLHDDPEVLVLAPNLGQEGTDEEQASGIIRIPQRCITKRINLDSESCDCRQSPHTHWCRSQRDEASE